MVKHINSLNRDLTKFFDMVNLVSLSFGVGSDCERFERFSWRNLNAMKENLRFKQFFFLRGTFVSN